MNRERQHKAGVEKQKGTMVRKSVVMILAFLFSITCLGLGASEGWYFEITPPRGVTDTTGNGDYRLYFEVVNKSTNNTYRGVGTVQIATACLNPDGNALMFSKVENFEIKNGDKKGVKYVFHHDLKLSKMRVSIGTFSPDGNTHFDNFNEVLPVKFH